MKIAFCIRGHIRTGFNDSQLKDYIKKLSTIHEVDIFLHTWKESEAKSSYRELDHTSAFKVTPKILKEYFGDLSIKNIIVDNDSKLELHGNLEGTIPNSKCPVIAWKRMWAGQFKMISYLYDNHRNDYDRVVNTRYDFFTHKLCYTPVKNLLKMTAEQSALTIKYPQYYRHLLGADNYYVGKLDTLYDLIGDFHYKLDDILEKYPIKQYQEELLYKYAKYKGLVA
jgi:uncharacterized protein YcgL (UPF0745 family)